MAKIAIYEGFGARRKKAKKSGKKRAKHTKRHSGRSGKANTPQARKFKAAIAHCGKQSHSGTIHSAQKALGACVRKFYRK